MNERTSENLLLIAARAPKPGFTKTRLGTAIGMERAANLYRAFLADLADRFAPRGNGRDPYQLGWAFTPAGSDFAAMIGGMNPTAAGPNVLFVDQTGESWGERQTNLLRWGYEQGYARTILIASDSPQLARIVVINAFAQLNQYDVIFGPVYDGGYYLIGNRGFHDVLTGVPMSTTSAAEALAARIDALGLRRGCLHSTFDVDVEQDLDLLIAALAPHGGRAPHSWRALLDLGIVQPERRHLVPKPIELLEPQST
jgi:glycosyltransferase A (GT-A) superfamily protein (DUF2064 family)